ncbi:hypothetical protein KIPB_005624 [Kipferlia bialata]|uniref:Uncharacterized protein n=1 Tax=Kipferlia bialata TaxID=797122 RepID=A0A9K3GHI5_9EUKA|nr:hypothetical protein KIPB_005624 [Kipferlia bialata]|eukprot:g5624.t1
MSDMEDSLPDRPVGEGELAFDVSGEGSDMEGMEDMADEDLYMEGTNSQMDSDEESDEESSMAEIAKAALFGSKPTFRGKTRPQTESDEESDADAPAWARKAKRVQRDAGAVSAAQSSAALVRAKPKPTSSLRVGWFDATKKKDLRSVRGGKAHAEATKARGGKGAVSTIAFHKNSLLCAVGGLDRNLSVYHVDGTENARLQSVHFKDMPPRTAWFGETAITCMGRRGHYFSLDLLSGDISRIAATVHERGALLSHEIAAPAPNMPYFAVAGANGYVYIVSTVTRAVLHRIHTNANVLCLCWLGGDVPRLVVGGRGGRVYVFSVSPTRLSLLCDFRDQGAASVTAVAGTVNGNRLYVGQDSGIVNVYDVDGASLSQEMVPVGVIDCLTTDVTTIAPHPSGVMVAVASDKLKDSARIVSMAPSGKPSVCQNWPPGLNKGGSKNLGKVTAMAWSPNGRWLCVGNARGRVAMWSVTYFEQNPVE